MIENLRMLVTVVSEVN